MKIRGVDFKSQVHRFDARHDVRGCDCLPTVTIKIDLTCERREAMVNLDFEPPSVTIAFHNAKQPRIDFGQRAGRVGQLRYKQLLQDTIFALNVLPSFYGLWAIVGSHHVGPRPSFLIQTTYTRKIRKLRARNLALRVNVL
jgi:hypothetical protein